MDGEVRNFNITLVLVAMREGDPKSGDIVNIQDTRLDNIESEERIPLIRRFVSFIEATTLRASLSPALTISRPANIAFERISAAPRSFSSR